MATKYYIKRGTKAQYSTFPRKNGELYYLEDDKKLAGAREAYQVIISGGNFYDKHPTDPRDCIDGGEF